MTIKMSKTGWSKAPRKFEKWSVINQNNYTRNMKPVVIKTEDQILKGREQDRIKISMSAVPFKEGENKNK